MTPAGLEPAIPGSVGRCLIHWATGPDDDRRERGPMKAALRRIHFVCINTNEFYDRPLTSLTKRHSLPYRDEIC